MDSAAPAYPWLKSYPPEIDWAAPLPAKPLFALLDDAAALHPDNDCIEFLDKHFAYAEVKELSDRAAKGLIERGFKPGMKLGLFLPNCPWFVVFYYAGLKAGGVIVNFNPLYVEPEIARQIADSETDFMVTLDLAVLLPKITAQLGTTRLQGVVVCPMAEQLPFPQSFLFPLMMRKSLAHVPEDERCVAMRDLIDNDGAITLPAIDPVTTLAVLQYTGGTTGVPKGAALSHANIYINAQQIRLWFRNLDRPETQIVGVLPLFHAFAMTCVMNLSLAFGACMLLQPRFEPLKLLRLIARKRPNAMAGVPTLYNALLNTPGAEKFDLSSLQMCISGGAPLPLEVAKAFQAKTGAHLLEGYGLSETSPVVCVNPPDRGSKPGSIGLPIPGTICEVVSLEDRKTLLQPGETGEICFRGPQVMMGYWNKPEATAEVIIDGRLHTGDVGHIDADGYVFVTDRLKEMINCSGFKVYPRLVEEAIYQHPSVRECAVIGVPDTYRGQTVRAIVALKADMLLSQDELDRFLETRLSKIEKPTQYEFRADLPKTAVGKIQKKILIDEAAAAFAAANGKKKPMREAVIAGYVRSPFHFANKGDLIKVRPDDLTAAVVKALIARTGVDPKDIEDLLLGCAFPEGEQGLNVARLIDLIADLPQSVAGATINRFCGSSMQAVHSAAGAIAMGAGDVFICAGVESMTRVPMMGFNPMPNPALNDRLPAAYISMGTTAENVAKKYGITRQEQEAFAVESQAKATAARQAGKLTEEITPIQNGKDAVTSDGCIREGTTLEALAGLKPAFDEKGVVTAGTSSPLTDGAAACLVTSAEYAKAHGMKVLAKVKSVAVAGCAPEIMGIGPVAATQKALKRAGLTIDQIDVIELNEAFAAQALACMRDLKIDPKKVNLDGGAIALGHPLGATGARITGKAAALLKREGKQFALSTQCIGGGQGIATILEAV